MVTISKPTHGGFFPMTYLRVRNTTRQERAYLEEKIADGWSYCPKSVWKKNVRD